MTPLFSLYHFSFLQDTNPTPMLKCTSLMSPGETIPLQTRLWTSLKPSLLTFITRSFSLNTIVGLRPETNHT